MGGAAVSSGMDGSVSGDQGLNTVVRNMDIGMNRQEQYGWNCVWRQAVSDVLNRVWVELRSGVSWVEVWSETGRRTLMIGNVDNFGSLKFLIFFVGGTFWSNSLTNRTMNNIIDELWWVELQYNSFTNRTTSNSLTKCNI